MTSEREPGESAAESAAEPDLDLDVVQARCDAATGGPWFAASHNKRKDGIALVGAFDAQGTGHALAVLAGIQVRQRHHDAEFIAHARIDVPRLVARVRELEQGLAKANSLTAATAVASHCAALHRPDPRMKGFYVCNQDPGHDGDHLAKGFNMRWPRHADDRCLPARVAVAEQSGTADD